MSKLARFHKNNSSRTLTLYLRRAFYAPAADLFARNTPGVAWKSKPSWYIVANNERTLHPDLPSTAAISHPDLIMDVIRAAANREPDYCAMNPRFNAMVTA